MVNFDFDNAERTEFISLLFEKIADFYDPSASQRVAPELDANEIHAYLNNLQEPVHFRHALNHVVHGLAKYTVHTTDSMYFGLFNPRANITSVAADLIAALFNPQLAAWSHAPFAVQVERLLVHEIAKKFGYEEPHIDGVFTAGGAEANLTALITALHHKYPDYGKSGLTSMKARPTIYCSKESHHSILKAAKIAGLGYDSVREISFNSVGDETEDIRAAIMQDKEDGRDPLMLVVTMGTTGAGLIEPMQQAHELASYFGLWLHADAAYSGAAILSTTHQAILTGIENADSITFDAHKWMSVSMSASMFLTRHKDVLGQSFNVSTDYMPKEGGALDVQDPYMHSIQWSRRFTGLKVYLSILVFGWKGYEEVINHHFLMGELMRKKLADHEWLIFNYTPLPVICFGKKEFLTDVTLADQLCQEIIRKGEAWLSVYPIDGIHALRLCITNFRTTELELDKLILILERTWKEMKLSRSLQKL